MRPARIKIAREPRGGRTIFWSHRFIEYFPIFGFLGTLWTSSTFLGFEQKAVEKRIISIAWSHFITFGSHIMGFSQPRNSKLLPSCPWCGLKFSLFCSLMIFFRFLSGCLRIVWSMIRIENRLCRYWVISWEHSLISSSTICVRTKFLQYLVSSQALLVSSTVDPRLSRSGAESEAALIQRLFFARFI